MKMLDFKVKRFVGIIFHLILAQICLAQTGIANQIWKGYSAIKGGCC